MENSKRKDLELRAEKGDIDALVELGNYYNGLLKSEEAFYYYKKAADLGYVPAIFQVGLRYIDGDGVGRSMNQGQQYLQKAADKGYANALYCLGLLYQSGEVGFWGQEKKAFKCFSEAAEKGHAKAQIELGNMYMEKRKIEQAIFCWACAYVHGTKDFDASEAAKDQLNDFCHAFSKGYDIADSIIKKVQRPEYSQYTNNPKFG